MEGKEIVISVKGLSQRYGKGRIIYDNLSFDVPKGRILGLLGKNGTGKTTTINILMGYLRPQSGVCKIFGEDITKMSAATRERIALLLEGHVQYAFMTIGQIERFYSQFYKKWNRAAYYELMEKLKVTPDQKLSSMSCGQRSQVALGLILAQNADLLVLDDFSLGLDPGYRRLFTDYLREYAKAENKTVFMTSHIIQDMERLIDDCIIMDYGSILIQKPVPQLLDTFRRYTFRLEAGAPETLPVDGKLYHSAESDSRLYSTSRIRENCETFSFETGEAVRKILEEKAIEYKDLRQEKLSLEDIFIGLTGKY